MADSSINHDNYLMFYRFLSNEHNPPRRSKRRRSHRIVFNFFFTYEDMKWFKDQDSIWMLQHDDSHRFKKTAVATIERMSFEEVSEPIRKLLEPLWMLRGWIEHFTARVWRHVRDELTAGNKIANLDVGVNIQRHVSTTKKEDCVVRDGPCSICLEEEELPRGELVAGACSHAFHQHCLKKWLMRSRACPLCRRDMGGLFYYLHYLHPDI